MTTGAARLALILAALGVGACGADMAMGDDDGGGGGGTPCDAGGNLMRQVSPYDVTRGAEVELILTWRTGYPLENPTATLDLDDGAVQVEAELAYDAESSGVDGEYAHHEGQLLNPFGAGAPPGTVQVLFTADPFADCGYAPSATTTFRLE